MAKDEWKEVTPNNVWDRKAPIQGELVKVQSDVPPNGSMMYTLKTKDGNVGVWGSTVIDTKMESVPQGVMVRIEPLGLTKSPKSGREYQDFRVFFKDVPFKEVQQSDVDDIFNNIPPDFLQPEGA